MWVYAFYRGFKAARYDESDRLIRRVEYGNAVVKPEHPRVIVTTARAGYTGNLIAERL